MRLSVVWPALISALVFGEVPSLGQGAGILLAFVAVVLLAARSGLAPAALRGAGPGWMVGLFIVSGGCGSLLKLFHQLGAADERPAFLVLIFLSAGVLCWAWVAWRAWRFGERLHRTDLRDGLLFGVGNVVGNGFLLKSLQTVPGVVAFPLRDSACIVAVSLIGVWIWKERPGALGWAALAAAAFGVILMVF
jgi:drug/metabolite transporter (DMT)-like permease